MRFEIHFVSDDQHSPLNGTWERRLSDDELLEMARDYDLRGSFDGMPLEASELFLMGAGDVATYDGEGCKVTVACKG